MPASKAQQRAVAKYMAANYEVYANQCGESINGLVNSLLRNTLGQSEEEWKRAADEQGDA